MPNAGYKQFWSGTLSSASEELQSINVPPGVYELSLDFSDFSYITFQGIYGAVEVWNYLNNQLEFNPNVSGYVWDNQILRIEVVNDIGMNGLSGAPLIIAAIIAGLLAIGIIAYYSDSIIARLQKAIEEVPGLLKSPGFQIGVAISAVGIAASGVAVLVSVLQARKNKKSKVGMVLMG